MKNSCASPQNEAKAAEALKSERCVAADGFRVAGEQDRTLYAGGTGREQMRGDRGLGVPASAHFGQLRLVGTPCSRYCTEAEKTLERVQVGLVSAWPAGHANATGPTRPWKNALCSCSDARASEALQAELALSE